MATGPKAGLYQNAQSASYLPPTLKAKSQSNGMAEMYRGIFGVCHHRVVKTYQPFLVDPKIPD